MKRFGFTLIELLIVIGIIAVVAAILFPVFLSVRERGRRTACLSNERQLGMAMMQYVTDSGETFPGGLMWAGEKWVSQTYPYVKAAETFACPSDGSAARDDIPAGGFPVGYGLNSNLARAQLATDFATGKIVHPAEGFSLVDLTAPAKTVLFFEVGPAGAILNGAPNAEDGSVVGNAGITGSAPSDGKGGTLT
ncbi:MAG: type II secretion system GspH family protein, partial [Armatimonadota bacterium]|nr:type II secretion system GspH family protein [Armatimonadota bacterium]